MYYILCSKMYVLMYKQKTTTKNNNNNKQSYQPFFISVSETISFNSVIMLKNSVQEIIHQTDLNCSDLKVSFWLVLYAVQWF